MTFGPNHFLLKAIYHVTYWITLKKPSKCNFCTKSFSKKEYLFHHMKTYTREKTFKFIKTHTRGKSFQCNFCTKSFSQQIQFYGNRQIHTKKSSLVEHIESVLKPPSRIRLKRIPTRKVGNSEFRHLASNSNLVSAESFMSPKYFQFQLFQLYSNFIWFGNIFLCNLL